MIKQGSHWVKRSTPFPHFFPITDRSTSNLKVTQTPVPPFLCCLLLITHSLTLLKTSRSSRPSTVPGPHKHTTPLPTPSVNLSQEFLLRWLSHWTPFQTSSIPLLRTPLHTFSKDDSSFSFTFRGLRPRRTVRTDLTSLTTCLIILYSIVSFPLV